MRTLSLLLALLLPSLALAQPTAPPPPPDEGASTGPATAAEEEARDDDEGEETEGGSERGPFWAAAAAGALPCVAADAVGFALAGLGCVFASITPGEADNCAEACVLAVVQAGMLVLGIVFGVASFVVLGPIAGIVVTIAATVGSAIAGRAFWGAAVGGLPGILFGVGGLALAGFGLSELSVGSEGLVPTLFSGDPNGTLVITGLALAASAGVVSLVGAVLGDVAFTSLLGDEEEAPPAKATSSRRPAREELPLAFEPSVASIAY